MALWNYCAICGKRIEVGEPCIGVENNTELIGDSICLDCAKIENMPDRKDHVPITDLLARAEEAEANNKKLLDAMMHIRKTENFEKCKVVYEMEFSDALDHERVSNIAAMVFRGLMEADIKRSGKKEE